MAVAYDIFRWKQLEFAYKEGTNLINNMQSTLTALIEAASVLGIFMVGALIATMINVDVYLDATHRGQSHRYPRHAQLDLPTLGSSYHHRCDLLVAWT